jgi:hypothetical protein
LQVFPTKNSVCISRLPHGATHVNIRYS